MASVLAVEQRRAVELGNEGERSPGTDSEWAAHATGTTRRWRCAGVPGEREGDERKQVPEGGERGR